MEYRYTCNTKPIDLFKLSMDHTYHSVAGVVNIVFMLAMVGMLLRFFQDADAFFRSLILIGLFWFPIVHPLAVFGKCVKQLEGQPENTELLFQDQGMTVFSDGQTEYMPWKKLVRISKQPGAVVIMTDTAHGYLLPNRVFQGEKDEFYQFLRSKVEKEAVLQ